MASEMGVNPDQRMQEDVRVVTEFTVELGIGILQSLMLLVSFVGVLWMLSTQVSFEIAGHLIAIPGYMVWCAVGYAALGSVLTLWVGRPMIRMNAERYAREGELRFALVRANENAESIALYGGEAREQRYVEDALQPVLVAMRRLSGALSRLTWITSGYGWLAIVVPILVASPGYFQGSLSLGGMMMVVGAFNQVQQALRWFVDHFPQIADWRAALGRVGAFCEAVDEAETFETAPAVGARPSSRGPSRLSRRFRVARGRQRRHPRGHGRDRPRRARPHRRGIGLRQKHAVARDRRAVALGDRHHPVPAPRAHDVHAAATLHSAWHLAGSRELPGVAARNPARPY